MESVSQFGQGGESACAALYGWHCCGGSNVVLLQLGDTSLPEEDPTAATSDDTTETEMDEELLQKLHHVLLEVRSGHTPRPMQRLY